MSETVKDNMGTERLFRTLVKIKHEKFGDKPFVIGKISGCMEIVCGCWCEDKIENVYPTYRRKGTDGYILTTKCTPKQYKTFAKFVKRRYPGLCEFNYIDEVLDK